MNRRPIRPRDAASLVLIRNSASGAEVLMGRRQSTLAFMPNAYVFPGGKVAPGDSLIQPASSLKGDYVRHMAVGGSDRRAHALAIAAVRETFEETGLLVGEPGEPGPAAAPAWAAFTRQGLAPALGRLEYLCRAITPTPSPIRFHARFFIADGDHASGALSGSGELVDLHWTLLSQAHRLPIADVTAFVLSEVQRLLAAKRQESLPKGMFTHRQGRPWIRYR